MCRQNYCASTAPAQDAAVKKCCSINMPPMNKEPLTAESFMLEKAEIVGNYAIQLKWKDGHDTGLYNWQFLRELAQLKN